MKHHLADNSWQIVCFSMCCFRAGRQSRAGSAEILKYFSINVTSTLRHFFAEKLK